jgi:CDP-glucose 4,6-dehydratase
MTEFMQLDSTFWCKKRVLVTGHTGFKGSWVCLWLQKLGAEVHGLALAPPTEPNIFHIAKVADGMSDFRGDVCNYEIVLARMKSIHPEIVLHMAAQPLVRRSYQQPIETFATNVMGTVHVMEAARLCGSVKAIVNITTDKCYENKEWAWGYRENEPMGGYDPYSSSKACAELVSTAYRQSFFKKAQIAMATARAGNVIGGGDWASERLVPDILRALQNKHSVSIRNPQAIRPWQHVLEPLSGYLLLAERLFKQGQLEAEAWNFGPKEEDARPVQWIVERLCQVWGDTARWHIQEGLQPHEAHYLKLDISKARQRLHWNPRWSIDTALQLTSDWHRAWLAGEDMHQLCIQQISQYGVHE